jgi:xanthine dehydrogenase accessory factor
MTDLEHVLPLWHELEKSEADYVLATIVAVDGPSYRKPGARMLLARDGRRAGTVSGGCLEAEVARRAWWLTESGPVVERYSTAEDDGDRPYGSGCGGVVFLLLERRATAAPLLKWLEAAFHARTPVSIATILDGPQICQRALAGCTGASINGLQVDDDRSLQSSLRDFADLALERCTTIEQQILINGENTRIWADYRPARPGLWIFSAGDDAKPLLHFARELGWFVAIADGRSHLATRERFSEADTVTVLPIADLPAQAGAYFSLRRTDAAVVMTHSFEQDSRVLASLLAETKSVSLAYLGVLGPQRRTRELLAEAARLLDLSRPAERAEEWLAQMHAPTGLDLGAETPATIALSILAEIQKALTSASAQPLSEVRACKLEVAQP